MRKLLALIVILAIVLGVGDVLARHEAEHLIAQRIDQKVPGARASVAISSFPFVGHVASSGMVPSLTAHVTGVTAAGVAFDTVDVRVTDLKIDRSQLSRGHLVILSIRQAVVHAKISAAAVGRAVGLSVTLGAGTVGVSGLGDVPAHLAIAGNKITVTVASLSGFTFTVPPLSLLPCVTSAVIVPGFVDLSCTTTTIPPALVQGLP